MGAAVPLLLKSGAAGLAWARVRQTRLQDSPAGRQLRDAFRYIGLQHALQERQLAACVSAMRSIDIEPLTGKGWAAARSYVQPGLRPPGDVDLYVPPDRYESARGASTPTDLHRGCDELDDRPWAALLDRSRLMTAAGVDVRVFGPEDHLRLLALHMLRHGAWRPLWLCDIAAAIESRAAELDWAHFLSGDPRRTDWAVCALVLARDLLGADLGGAPEIVHRRRLPPWLTSTVLRQWGDLAFEPHGLRRPMASFSRRPFGLVAALLARWPNAIEASVGRRAAFDGGARLPVQIAECLMRTGRFLFRARLEPDANGSAGSPTR